MSSRPLFVSFALTLVLFTGCGRETARPALERIAVLRFENLGPSPADDWMGQAFSEIIAGELQGVPGFAPIPWARLRAAAIAWGGRSVIAPGISTGRATAESSGATRIVYGQYDVRGGVLHASITWEDPATRKIVAMPPVTAPVDQLVPAASALAAQISPNRKSYPANNPFVLRAHVEAMEGVDRPGVAEDLEKAIAADPDFGPSYRQLAEWKVQQRDTGAALALLDRALARGPALGDAERARVQLLAAGLRDDSAARLQALNALAKADAGDPDAWQQLGAVATAAHRYGEAADAYRKLLDLEPGNVGALNLLGYAAAYAGDAATAVDALSRYRKLQPSSVNALDSLGDVHLIFGHMGDAEAAYLEGARKDPKFFDGLDLLKAAFARLATGDVPGADALAQRYFDALAAAKDAAADYRKAQWDWLAGRRLDAAGEMQKAAQSAEAGNVREVASRAYGELAMWNLMLGHRDAAAPFVQKAVALATQASASTAVLARFLSQPSASPAEWEKRATQIAPNPAQAAARNTALAYALLFDRQFAAAYAVLRQLYEAGTNPGDDLPVLLAWAGLECGHAQESAGLLRPNQPLSNTGPNWTTALVFPRIFYLRGLAARQQGKSAEAAAQFRLFRTLSGAAALMWGEEQKAQ